MFLLYFVCIVLLCTGCGANSLHGEFLVVVSEEKHCILKPSGENVYEELISSSGEVRPVQTSIPEDFTCQAGDFIEANFCIPQNDSFTAFAYPAIEIIEAEILEKAAPDTIREARNFEDEYRLTPEAEERWAKARLDEDPIRLPKDADWAELAFYGAEWTTNYRFTDAENIARIQELLQEDAWQIHTEWMNQAFFTKSQTSMNE